MDLPAQPWARLPKPVRVTDRRQEFAGTFTLTVDAPLLAVRPGQFVMIGKPGYGDVPISVSGSDGTAIALTVSAAGAASRAITEANPGEWLGAHGPYGVPWPLDSARGRDLIIMAGGLGLAPLRMAFLEARERAYGRVILLCGTRTPSRIAFNSELLDWICDKRAEVHVTVDSADASWRGNVGLITTLLTRKAIDPQNTVAFVCGPEVMMRFCARALVDRGIRDDHVFVSLERHMACGTGMCGRCQLGPVILCRDGPVLPFARVARPLAIAEL